jgi:hypothetical protein
MNFLEDKPIRCYHRELKTLFEIVTIDWLAREVKVVRTTINNGQETNQDRIIDSFPFSDVKIVRFAEKVDNQHHQIYEGNIVAYGDKLGFSGIVRYNTVLCQFMIENISGGDGERQRLADINPQYLHIIENNGRSVE